MPRRMPKPDMRTCDKVSAQCDDILGPFVTLRNEEDSKASVDIPGAERMEAAAIENTVAPLAHLRSLDYHLHHHLI